VLFGSVADGTDGPDSTLISSLCDDARLTVDA
jgi:hypothetical protein